MLITGSHTESCEEAFCSRNEVLPTGGRLLTSYDIPRLVYNWIRWTSVTSCESGTKWVTGTVKNGRLEYEKIPGERRPAQSRSLRAGPPPKSLASAITAFKELQSCLQNLLPPR